MSCIFCKIIKGEIPSEKIYEDEKVICFKDINPMAPIHVLVVPKKHIADLLDAAADKEILSDINNAIVNVADILGIKDKGFRTVINTGKDSGQAVEHLHFHILAGKVFGESFG